MVLALVNLAKVLEENLAKIPLFLDLDKIEMLK